MTKKIESSSAKRSLQMISARLLKENPADDGEDLKSEQSEQSEQVVSEPPVIVEAPKGDKGEPETARLIERQPDTETDKKSVANLERTFSEIPELQSHEAEVYQKLSRELLFDNTENVVSIYLDPSMILKVDLAIFKLLFEKRMRGITICIGRPSEFYINLLNSKGFNPDLLYYIDLLVLHSKKKTEERPNIKLVPHPSDFTAIDIAFNQSVEELERMKLSDERLFLLIDGLASHQLYTKPSSLGAFIHTMVSKARAFDILTIILLSAGVDTALTNTIKTFSDRIISID